MESIENPSTKYEAYSDESNYNSKYYASICLISLDSAHTAGINAKLKSILEESGVKELKWYKIRSAKDRFCANKVIDYIISILNTHNIRIDVVVWNVKDRKSRFKDNDIISLKKMYHQILKNVLKMRWSNNIQWDLFPDEQNNLDWKEAKEILDNTSLSVILKDNELEFKKDFNINKIKEVSSIEHPLCQVADLFAGLAVFSNVNKLGLPRGKSQRALFNTEGDSSSNTERERAEVFCHLRNICSSKINLKSTLPLESWPEDSLNFWNFKFSDKKDTSLKGFLQ